MGGGGEVVDFVKIRNGDDAPSLSNNRSRDVHMTVEDPASQPFGNNAYNEEVKEECFGVRHTVATLGMVACALLFAMRVNLSVAIVAMVTKKPVMNMTHTQGCPDPQNYNDTIGNSITGEFDWDAHTQGLILGSFFYGYVLTSIIGGRAAEKWGGRVFVGSGIVITGILTLLSPIAARTSATLFVAVRICEGLAGGVVIPALNVIIAKWFPEEERSKFASVIYLGIQLGTVIALTGSGWICDSGLLGGWPFVFYISGGLSLIWAAFWFTQMEDDPETHPRISKAELVYILEGRTRICKEHIPVPWSSIFSSRYFWAIAGAHFGNSWSFYTLLIELPTFLDHVLYVNLGKNGIMSSAPNLAAWVFGLVFSFASGRLISSRVFNVLQVRRLAAIFSYGPMIGIAVLCFVECNSTAVILALIIGGSCYGTAYCAHLSSHADISPKFAGTLMGLTTTFANCTGFLVPLTIGALTQNNHSINAWRTVFIIAAVIHGISVTFYLICVTTDVQPWNDPRSSGASSGTSSGTFGTPSGTSSGTVFEQSEQAEGDTLIKKIKF